MSSSSDSPTSTYNVYYEVNNEQLALLGSDGDSSRLPESFYKEYDNGTIEIFEPADEKQVKEWKMKIGTLLAYELGVVPKSTGRHFILTDFPSGYKLYVHKKGTKANPRHDNYLHGSRYVARFRSPNEFILHAHWLCIGAPLYPSPSNKPICQCKYCTGNENDAIEALASTSVYNSDEYDDDDDKKKKRRRSKSIFGNITHVKSRNKLQNRLLKTKKERFSQAEVSRQLTGRRPIRISTRNESKEEAEKKVENETVKREHKGVGGAIWSSKK